MTAFARATEFFHACDGLAGWEGCSPLVSEGAIFDSQCEPLLEIDTVQGYCEWMAGLGMGPLKGCHYELHASAWDEATRTALYFATFHGKHTGEGGPVPATGRETHSHYVYALVMDADDKVQKMTKIWNAPWSMAEMGWG